jgi:hypothetical protein
MYLSVLTVQSQILQTDIAVADAKSKVYDHLEQAGEINITPVKVEFETEQLKRKGTLQNTEYIELKFPFHGLFSCF